MRHILYIFRPTWRRLLRMLKVLKVRTHGDVSCAYGRCPRPLLVPRPKQSVVHQLL